MFLDARCAHLAGHFLGDPLLRRARNPVGEMKGSIKPLVGALAARSGVPRRERISNLKTVLNLIQKARAEAHSVDLDPIALARKRLEVDAVRLAELEADVHKQVRAAIAAATRGRTGANQVYENDRSTPGPEGEQ